MKRHIKQIECVLVIAIFIAFIIVISPRIMQNDTFWSIKVGEKIVNEGIFQLDDFSIHEDLQYIAHHFLTDVLIYIIYSIAGFNGLYIFEVILALVIGGLLYSLNKEISGSKTISVIFVFLQMYIMSNFIAVRAQMISYILFILELLLLEKYKKENKLRYIIGLGVIPIFLANFHMGAMPFYFVILGVYIISCIKIWFIDNNKQTDKLRLKQLILVDAIGAITIFINPYFVDGVAYPFKTFSNSFINSNILEFKQLSIAIFDGWAFVYIVIVISLLFINRRKIELADWLLVLGTLFMAFVAIRYVSLFVICSAVVIRHIRSLNGSFKFNKEETKAIKGAVLISLAAITLALYITNTNQIKNDYIPKEMYPVVATKFLKENITKQDRIFNEYNWGSYLMLNDIKVYIDSRCDLYTKEYNNTDVAEDYIKLTNCDASYKEIIEKYNLSTFIIPIDTPLATLLEENAEFTRIYKDDIAVIYMKK